MLLPIPILIPILISIPIPIPILIQILILIPIPILILIQYYNFLIISTFGRELLISSNNNDVDLDFRVDDDV